MILSVMMDRGPDYRHQVKCNRSSYSTTPWKWISWRSFDLLHFLEVCCPAQMQTIFFCAMFFKFLLSCQIKLSLAYMIYDGGMTWGGETPQGTGSIDCQYFVVVLEEGLYLRHYILVQNILAVQCQVLIVVYTLYTVSLQLIRSPLQQYYNLYLGSK